MRDHSADRIRAEFRERSREIESISTANRTESQQTQLRTIRSYERRRSTDIQTRAQIESHTDRYEQWREWSGKRGFPRRFERLTIQYNEEAGLPEFASFGYRRLFAEYVDGLTDADATDFAIYESDIAA
jgi:hypothetical protein